MQLSDALILILVVFPNLLVVMLAIQLTNK